MGLMDKIKNMFTEEEEIEEEPIKKEVIQVEIPSPMSKKQEKVEEKKEEIVKEEPKVEVQKPRPVEQPVQKKQEEKFIFPVYFDDDDFSTIEKKQKEEKKHREEVKTTEVRKFREEEKKPIKPISESYKGKTVQVEEKKTFKPTPIISPVYGILDKNYTKEDITVKNIDQPKKTPNVDLVRNKAYGSLEDEIVDSLDYEVPKKEHTTNDMEEYRKKMDEVDFNEMLENDSLDENLDELETKLTKTSKTKTVEPKYSRTARKKELEAQEIGDDLGDMIDTMYEEEK